MSNDEVFQLLDEMAQGQHAIMLRTLQRWAERDAAATTGALVEALGDEEVRIRARAAWALSLLGDVQQRPEVVPALVYHLESDPNAGVRFSCAVGLRESTDLQARQSYLHAVNDEDERVAFIACSELGAQGGVEARAALLGLLQHPSWRRRLEACKALISSGMADQQVVAALEKMQDEPEAAAYDAQIEEWQRVQEEALAENPDDPPLELWGKVGEILEQARAQAAL